jgi:hypothetical protein
VRIALRQLVEAGVQTQKAVAAEAPAKGMPNLTVPQWLAFAVFVIFVVFAGVSSDGTDALVQPDELDQIRLLALFVIGALLPSDLLVRFGRSLLFQKMPEDKQAEAASAAPATTLAQVLAFLAFVAVALLTLLSETLISSSEFADVNEVARVLIIALLPSEAGIRFGRALYYRAPTTPVPTTAQLARV